MINKKHFEVIKTSTNREGLELSFETGMLAPQADGAVVVTLGENKILFTAVMKKTPDMDRDFTPLTIDRKDSYSSVGKIGGGQYRKREGRPTDAAVLYGRMTDRAIRPLLPKGMVNDLVITITPLNIDKTQDLGALSIIGSSVALLRAGIPFAGPVGAVRLGYLDGKILINPTKAQIEASQMDLLVAGPDGLINMIESDAKQIPNDIIKQAFEIGYKYIASSIQAQQDFLSKCEIKPLVVATNIPSDNVIFNIKKILTDDKIQAMFGNSKVNFNELYYQYEKETIESLKTEIEDRENKDFDEKKVKIGVFNIIKKAIRKRTLELGKRFDDRDMMTVRDLYCQVGVLKHTHGTGLFRRGDTQVLSTVTLGAPGDHQVVDSMELDQREQRYMHHYNFPGFSTNEASASRGTGRREIGHGYLTEKALLHVIPPKTDFPYTIRVVSDCLASGGSTSQASVCGSTLALMDAGVPLLAPVAGIAMGLMTEMDSDGNILEYKILTDLAGTEDFVGDMDFKVAGSANGITAIQLDTKIPGLTYQMVCETIDQANIARTEILGFMLETIDQPRLALSPFAPKIFVFTIKPEKIKEVIGRGGEMIDKIIEKAGGKIKIDFEDDGTVYITEKDQASIDLAVKLIRDIADDLPLNVVMDGTISRIESYGMFVNLAGGKSGLVSARTLGVIGDLNKVYKIGQPIKVMVTEIDNMGRLVLKKS